MDMLQSIEITKECQLRPTFIDGVRMVANQINHSTKPPGLDKDV